MLLAWSDAAEMLACSVVCVLMVVSCARRWDAQDELIGILLANGSRTSGLQEDSGSRASADTDAAGWRLSVESSALDRSPDRASPGMSELLEERLDSSLGQLELMDDDGWSVSRSGVQPPNADSREARRSAVSEINSEEDRGRCLTAVETVQGLDPDPKQLLLGESTFRWESARSELAGSRRNSEADTSARFFERPASSRTRSRGLHGWN